MADAIRLQPWISIGGSTSSVVVTQQESCYVDLTAYTSVVAYAEVSDVAEGGTITYQTSPTKDETLWQDVTAALSPSVGTNTTIMRYESATVPPARWFRWKCVGSASNWRLTFRIWLSCTRGLPAFFDDVDDCCGQTFQGEDAVRRSGRTNRVPTGRSAVVLTPGSPRRRL